MPYYGYREELYAKIEPIYGIDATPAAADVVACAEVTVNPAEIDYAQRSLSLPYMGRQRRRTARAKVTLEVSIEAAGFGAAGPASPLAGYDALIRICAHSRTVTANTKVDYAPVSANSTTTPDAATIYFNHDGMLHKALGCRGSLKLSYKRNGNPMCKFTIWGLYGGVTSAAFVGASQAAWQEPVPYTPENVSAISFMGVSTLPFESIELDQANTLQYRNLPNGTKAILITRRDPTLSVEIETPTIAQYDVYAAIMANSTGAFSHTHGPATNQIILTAPRISPGEPKRSKVDDIAHLQLTCDVLPSAAAGNDEYLISVR